MALFLTESDVQNLLPISKALELTEASLLAQGEGRAVNHPRRRILMPDAALHYMAAAYPDQHYAGMKIYTTTSGAWRFVVLLFDTKAGELVAIIEADHLGRLRTGAASGIATRIMARPDASTVTVVGTGRQARTQVQAVNQVRKLSAVYVYSRNPDRVKGFCDEMSPVLGVQVNAATNLESAVRASNIVITATTAKTPVLSGDWLQSGTHINAIGANMGNRREIDGECLKRAGLIAVDSLDQAREEAGDLIRGFAEGNGNWESVKELGNIVAHRQAGRTHESQITLFKSSGIALWDVAAAMFLYDEARRQGLGREWALTPAV